MTGRRFMLIAGETSGDLLAAELVAAIRRAEAQRGVAAPAGFFGAGGPQMQAAGVDLALDLTRHSVVGLWEVLRKLGEFKRLFDRLFRLAHERQPDVIVCVDFGGFNRRFAHAVRTHVSARRGFFRNWNPLIVQYVSPQVWASRPGRAYDLARDVDLLLCLLPFEKAWYAARVPDLHVEFVGHPIVERHLNAECGMRNPEPETRRAGLGARNEHAVPSLAPVADVRPTSPVAADIRRLTPTAGGESKGIPEHRGRAPNAAPALASPLVLLLPGSRRSELSRHLKAMIGAAQHISGALPGTRFRMILPNEELRQLAHVHSAVLPALAIQVGGLSESLREAALALASTGTVTLECALFGVPTVALYKTSWPTYVIARSIATVDFIAMPNLLAGEVVFPELLQHQARPENLAREALALLTNLDRRQAIQAKLARVVASLGGPGASDRAAAAILSLTRGVHP